MSCYDFSLHTCGYVSLSFHPFILFFFFNVPATTEIYTLSLHDALPICSPDRPRRRRTSSGCCAAAASTSRTSTAARSRIDRKSTRLNSSHVEISYAVFCLKKKKKKKNYIIPINKAKPKQ